MRGAVVLSASAGGEARLLHDGKTTAGDLRGGSEQ
jgi:hypothetical protein